MRRLVVAALLLIAPGCVSTGRLAEFDFSDRSIVATSWRPVAPVLELSVNEEDEDDDPDEEEEEDDAPGLLEVLAVTASVVYEIVEVERAEDKLMAASREIDVAERVSETAIDETARLLGARVEIDEEAADFELRIAVPSYGLEVAEAWENSGFWMSVDAELIHRASNAVVWSTSVEATDRTYEEPLISDATLNSILNATDLSEMTVETVVWELESLADHCAYLVVEQLARSLEKVRESDRSHPAGRSNSSSSS